MGPGRQLSEHASRAARVKESEYANAPFLLPAFSEESRLDDHSGCRLTENARLDAGARRLSVMSAICVYP